jgi:hypothetical protein
LSVVVGVTLWWLDRQLGWQAKSIRIVALLVLLGNLALGGSVLYWNGAYRVLLGLESRDAYLTRFFEESTFETFPDAAMIDYLNRDLPPGARILVEHAGNVLYLQPDVISPTWGERERLDDITDAETLLDTLKTWGVDYILVSDSDPDTRFLYTRPDFLAAHAELIFSGTRTRLYRLLE